MTSAQGAPDPAELALESRPNSMGRYGQFGGQYVPETLIPALAELEQAAAEAWKDPAFTDRLNHLLRTYVGRPNPLYEAERLSEHYRRPEGGPRIWLKREDLNHTGAHKINNALGAAVVLAEPLRFIEGVGPADVGAQQMVEPVGEGGILPGFRSGLLQFRQGGNQGFGDVLTAELAVATHAVGPGLQGHCLLYTSPSPRD